MEVKTASKPKRKSRYVVDISRTVKGKPQRLRLTENDLHAMSAQALISVAKIKKVYAKGFQYLTKPERIILIVLGDNTQSRAKKILNALKVKESKLATKRSSGLRKYHAEIRAQIEMLQDFEDQEE